MAGLFGQIDAARPHVVAGQLMQQVRGRVRASQVHSVLEMLGGSGHGTDSHRRLTCIGR